MCTLHLELDSNNKLNSPCEYSFIDDLKDSFSKISKADVVKAVAFSILGLGVIEASFLGLPNCLFKLAPAAYRNVYIFQHGAPTLVRNIHNIFGSVKVFRFLTAGYFFAGSFYDKDAWLERYSKMSDCVFNTQWKGTK